MAINYKKDTKHGKYTIQNPQKYMSSKPPWYKSRWELLVFHALDINPYVLKWGYEAIEIYYHHPFYMNWTVYYPDIFCHVKTASGQDLQLLVEIKPSKFMTMPKEPKKPKNTSAQSMQKYQKSLIRYESSKRDYMVNMAKWEAAQSWCLKHNVQWRILNDKNTNGLFG